MSGLKSHLSFRQNLTGSVVARAGGRSIAQGLSMAAVWMLKVVQYCQVVQLVSAVGEELVLYVLCQNGYWMCVSLPPKVSAIFLNTL